MTASNSYFEFPEYECRGTDFPVPKLALLQVDIEDHSRLSKECAADTVMEAKIKLAEALQTDLGNLDFRGVFWAGDGGMFAIRIIKSRDTVALIDAWRRIRVTVGHVNQQYRTFLDSRDIRLRVSAHVADVRVHSDPRYWHSDELNYFAKKEREIGQVGAFRITGAAFESLPHEERKRFKATKDLSDGKQHHRVFQYVDEAEQKDAPSRMRQILPVIKSIVDNSRAYRKGVMQGKGRPAGGSGDVLFVVDVQKDFCDPTSEHLAHLFVEHTDTLVSSLNGIISAAKTKGIPIVFTRDWHPPKHPSFLLNKGVWREHCVAESTGAEFHERLSVPEESIVANIGAANNETDYTPFTDQSLIDFLSESRPKRMLVTGIALEYCVLATCLDGLAHVEEVTVLEEYVRAADSTSEVGDMVWQFLREDGVKRIESFSLSTWS